MTTPPRSDIPKLSDLNLVVDTARLKLRPLEPGDAEAMFATASTAGFSDMMSWNAHRSIDETRAWIETCRANIVKNTHVTWAILKDGAFVGSVSLDGITWHSAAWRRDKAEIGYWVAPTEQKHGYATEATMAVMKFGFETLGLHRVVIGCLAENVASKRVIEKAGFRFLCRIDEDVWRNDRWWSHLRYEITIGEWSDISSTLRFSRPRPAP